MDTQIDATTLLPPANNYISEIANRVSGYFRDFLETDFKRSQAPRRRITTTNDGGFRTGIRALPYPQLNTTLWTQLSRPSGDERNFTVRPRQYTRPISLDLKRVIAAEICEIKEATLESIRQTVKGKAEDTRIAGHDDPEQWIGLVQATLFEAASSEIVKPLIASLSGALARDTYSLIDSLSVTEAELVQGITATLSGTLPETLATLRANSASEDLANSLRDNFTLDGVKSSLIEFFETFAASDFFTEFRDLETHVKTSESLQAYLYIGSLSYRNNRYPLFYVPLDVCRPQGSDGYTVTLTNRLFANRRAIDYVLQELGAEHQRSWVSPIRDRILYLDPTRSVYEEARGLFDLIANALDLGGQAMFGSAGIAAGNANVKLDSDLNFAAFESADEALVNDYEVILDQFKNGGSAIVDLFNGIVEGVLMKNPEPIRADVDAEWVELELTDRMVFDSPIPLNEEQRKVLMAVRNRRGKIIVVEGPPGTGKSHTITAIAADCAFNQKSCLVLSDKKEALDVVHEKLSMAMSRVRHDRTMPNPLLRLGQNSANFRKLTSNQSIGTLTNYVAATRSAMPDLLREKEGLTNNLRGKIGTAAKMLSSVSLEKVEAMHVLENLLRERSPAVLEQVEAIEDSSKKGDIARVVDQLEQLHHYLKALFEEEDYDYPKLKARLNRDRGLAPVGQQVSLVNALKLFPQVDSRTKPTIDRVILQYKQLKMPLFGYLFRGGQVRALETEISQLAPRQPILLKESLSALEQASDALNKLSGTMEAARISSSELEQTHRDLVANRINWSGAAAAADAMSVLDSLNPQLVPSLLAEPKDDADLWSLTIKFLHNWMETREAFLSVPQFNYAGSKDRLDQLNTSIMNAHVDERLVSFMDNHRADARSLATVISNRQKFPVDKFGAMKDSFPVIIASIREFAEYMPLAPELFDVLVIDEGSQVSVAQALPAMLRAKKVVILGDTKQFSNVKSANASIALNDKHRSELLNFFRTNVSTEADILARLSMFDVKKSILDFANMCASYSVMLRKHFRSYPELISYSSQHFYSGQLQALKIRSKPISEVVEFAQVDPTGHSVTNRTNEAEAQYILERLIQLVDMEKPPSVGVITPYADQAKILTKQLFSHMRGAEFEDKLRLKVMTFDSCQGEERETIFYSMVASPGHNLLNYIFPVELDPETQDVENKLKQQRLNVGFSRAQEHICIVHSMQIDQFRGSIAMALQHYKNVLARPDTTTGQTDPSSPMEEQVLHYLQTTPFVVNNPDAVEIRPQFPVGEYLRQLDPTYEHPAFRVDFLVIVQTAKGPLRIIVEYDGFQHHFQNRERVNSGNYRRYMNASDLERQLILESYGYRFIRINRFNLGRDPVQTLSDRMQRLVDEEQTNVRPIAVERLTAAVNGLSNREMKTCSTCGQVKAMEEFWDSTLSRGTGSHGRKCNTCKGRSTR